MIPLGVLAGSRHVAAGGGGTLAHDVFDCNAAHTLSAHVAAGHPIVGAFVSSNNSNTVVDPANDTLYFSNNSIYNGRQLADVGTTDATVSARIVGRVLSGTTAQDRHYGLGIGMPAATNPNGIGGVVYHITYDGILTGGQITSGWAPPSGKRVSGIAMSNDMLMSVTLDGLSVTVDIDGTTVYTTTLAAAPTGTHAGASQARTQWLNAVGYKFLKVEAL